MTQVERERDGRHSAVQIVARNFVHRQQGPGVLWQHMNNKQRTKLSFDLTGRSLLAKYQTCYNQNNHDISKVTLKLYFLTYKLIKFLTKVIYKLEWHCCP